MCVRKTSDAVQKELLFSGVVYNTEGRRKKGYCRYKGQFETRSEALCSLGKGGFDEGKDFCRKLYLEWKTENTEGYSEVLWTDFKRENALYGFLSFQKEYRTW